MKRNSTSEYLSDFTRREDALLLRLRNINISSDQLPHRLFNWRQMIGDSQIYLNELRNQIEIEESKTTVRCMRRFGILRTLVATPARSLKVPPTPSTTALETESWLVHSPRLEKSRPLKLSVAGLG